MDNNKEFKIVLAKGVRMKKLEAIMRPEKMPVVKERLRQHGIGGMTISNVSGWSKRRELHLQ